LSDEDRIEVEEALESDAGFKKQFEQQKDFIRIAQRIALKKQIQEATRQSSFWIEVAKRLFGGSIVSGVLALLFMVNQPATNVTKTVVPEVEDIEVVLPVAEEIDSVETTPGEVVITEDVSAVELVEACEDDGEVFNGKPVIINDPKKARSNNKLSKVNKDQAISIHDFNGLKTWVKPYAHDCNSCEGSNLDAYFLSNQNVIVVNETCRL
jgi:hypothetical protein